MPKIIHNGIEILSGGGSTAATSAGSIIKVLYDENEAGKTVTLTTPTGTVYTETLVSDNGLAVVTFINVIEVGTMTIACEDSTSIDIAIPYYGAYEINANFAYSYWLTLGGLSSSSYDSLDAILADEKAVRQLMTVHASADYLVKFMVANEDIRATFIANKNAMKWIGLRDYICDKLMAVSEIQTAMLASDNWEYILKDHVPVMTSNTAPYGEVNTSGNNSEYPAYNIFCGDESKYWVGTGITNNYVQYKFANPLCVKKVFVNPLYDVNGNHCKNFDIQASNDNSSWETLFTYTFENIEIKDGQYFDINNDSYYLYYRIYIYNTAGNNTATIALKTLQFYGRSLNVSVPTMTSNTAPWGEAFASSVADSSNTYQPYRAFDGTTNYYSNKQNSLPCQLGYKFSKNVIVRKVAFSVASSGIDLAFTIEGSQDNSSWDILETIKSTFKANTLYYYDIECEKEYKCFRINFTSSSSGWCVAKVLQFYGVDYSEREFEEGSTMKYIYDHGVELEEIDKYNVYGTPTSEFNKLENQFFISKTSSDGSNNICVARTNNFINMSDYSFMLVNIGDGYVGSNASIGIVNAAYNSQSTTTLSNFKTQFDNYVDISSVQDNLYPVVYPSQSSASTGSVYIAEWWLE